MKRVQSHILVRLIGRAHRRGGVCSTSSRRIFEWIPSQPMQQWPKKLRPSSSTTRTCLPPSTSRGSPLTPSPAPSTSSISANCAPQTTAPCCSCFPRVRTTYRYDRIQVSALRRQESRDSWAGVMAGSTSTETIRPDFVALATSASGT